MINIVIISLLSSWRWALFLILSGVTTNIIFYKSYLDLGVVTKELYENGGVEALQEISRKKPLIANRVEAHIEKAVIDMAIYQPTWGQLRLSNELKKDGIIVSPGGVRSIWLRNDLHNFKKRLEALEAKSAQDGIVLTENQLLALEKKKDKLEALGEIITEHPAYLVSQDIYYVATIKGVGKISQQTVIDTYSLELEFNHVMPTELLGVEIEVLFIFVLRHGLPLTVNIRVDVTRHEPKPTGNQRLCLLVLLR